MGPVVIAPPLSLPSERLLVIIGAGRRRQVRPSRPFFTPRGVAA